MICPNCQFENFTSSSSCVSCGKPFHLVRNSSNGKKKPEAKTKAIKSQAKTEPKRPKSPTEKPVFIPEPVISHDSVPKGVTLKVRSKRKISPFRLLLLVSIAVMGILATLMIFKLPEQKEPMPLAVSTGETAVAVLCFRNDTGKEELDTWEKGLAQALTLDLLQSKSIKVLRGERMFREMKKLGLWEKRQKKYAQSDLKRIASSTGATVFVMGSISRSAGGYKVNAVFKGASGNSLFSDSLECSGEDEIFSRVDALADMVRANFAIPVDRLSGEEDRNIQEITTMSADAFKHFVSGRCYFWQKDYDESIEALRFALREEPEFALAHMQLASVFQASGYRDRARKQLQAAQGLIDHVSERERFHLQGEFYRLSEKTYDIALKIYTRLLELYPDDPRGNVNLGVLYTQLGQWGKATECFRVNIKNRIGSPNTYLGYADNFTKQGLYNEAENILSGYIEKFSDDADVQLHLAWLHLLQRDYNRAHTAIKKGTALNPSYRLNLLNGDLQMLRGDLIGAEAEYARLQEKEDPIYLLWGRQRMADLYLLEGKFQQARDQLRAGLEEAASQEELGWQYRFHLDLARLFLDSGDPTQTLRQCSQAWEIAIRGVTSVFPREVLHLQGLANLALNRRSELEKTVLRLKSLCEKGPSSDRMRYYYHLKGEIELSGGDFTQAVDYFAQSFDHLPAQGKPWLHGDDHALFIDSLAEALYAAGEPIKALEKLEELRALSVGRLAYGDMYARSYYKLGKIREENGLSDIAIEFYHRFLALWEAADPGIPEVLDARQRIAAAQGR